MTKISMKRPPIVAPIICAPCLYFFGYTVTANLVAAVAAIAMFICCGLLIAAEQIGRPDAEDYEATRQMYKEMDNANHYRELRGHREA